MKKGRKSVEIIKFKKVFEKQLKKLNGFSEISKCHGIDSHSILFLPELDVLVAAGIHELNESPQFLCIYKIDAEIEKSSKISNYPIQRRASEICPSLSHKKRSSAIYDNGRGNKLETEFWKQFKNGENKKKLKLKSNSGQLKDDESKETQKIEEIISQNQKDVPGKILFFENRI